MEKGLGDELERREPPNHLPVVLNEVKDLARRWALSKQRREAAQCSMHLNASKAKRISPIQIEQIVPGRIARLDQLDLPTTCPPFELLLSSQCIEDSVIRLQEDEPSDSIARDEFAAHPSTVLLEPPPRLVGYTNVEGPAVAGENVDEVLLSAHGSESRSRRPPIFR